MNRIRKAFTPSVILMVIGFTVSFASVMIGISTIEELLEQLAQAKEDIPLLWTMQNTGLSLAMEIYVFSIVNCLIVTNDRIVTQTEDMAIRKAFGWTNTRLNLFVIQDTAGILLVSLGCSVVLLTAIVHGSQGLFQIRLSPFFIGGTCVLFLCTLIIASMIPMIRIMRIHPSQVVS
ncbi:MAG: FtsX-like permease family protein [Bulleidia sp.]